VKEDGVSAGLLVLEGELFPVRRDEHARGKRQKKRRWYGYALGGKVRKHC